MAAAKQSVRNDAEAASVVASRKKDMDDIIAKGFRERDEQDAVPGQGFVVRDLVSSIDD